MLTMERFLKLRGSHPVTLISLDDRDSFARDHLDGAIDVPAEELSLRAPIELRKNRLQVVDCTLAPAETCSLQVDTLRNLGFLTAALDASHVGDGVVPIRRVGSNVH